MPKGCRSLSAHDMDVLVNDAPSASDAGRFRIPGDHLSLAGEEADAHLWFALIVSYWAGREAEKQKVIAAL